MIDLENSRHGLYADSKIETNCDFIQSTFRLWGRWLLVMSTFYLLGRCHQFGFGYTKLNRTALQLRSIADINLRYIIIKFGYDVRFHWLIERAESEYKTRSWAKAVTPSANFYYVRPFSGLLYRFFSSIKKWNFRASEPASSIRWTKERFVILKLYNIINFCIMIHDKLEIIFKLAVSTYLLCLRMKWFL